MWSSQTPFILRYFRAEALAGKASFLATRRRKVQGHDVGLQPMEPQLREGNPAYRAHGFGHIPAALQTAVSL